MASGKGWMERIRSHRLRLIVATLVLMSCIGCDQATKSLATLSMRDAPARTYLNGIVRIEYALNAGCCLNLGSTLPSAVRSVLFIGLNGCLMLAVCSFLFFKRDLPFFAYLAILLLLAGGIGNLIDRVTNQGLVTDFLNLGIGPVRTGIFNVADIAVTCGALAILVWTYRQSSAARPLATTVPV